jgi:hypothetical protein
MCADHSPQVTDGRDRPSNAEFSDLDLKRTKCGEEPIHCEKHQHRVRHPQPWMTVGGAALAPAALIAFVLVRNVGLGLVALALSLGLMGYGAALNRRRTDTRRRCRPDLPLLPRFERVQVQESVKACITLDPQGRYRTTCETVTGHLTIAATLGRSDRDRVQRYRRKHGLTDNMDIDFHLGFAVLRGRAALALEHGSGAHDERVLALKGRVLDCAFLHGESARATRAWRKELEYEVPELPGGGKLPISLTPSLVQAADRRALDLDFQWTELQTADGRSRLAIDRVETLELRVPVDWGDVRHVEGEAVLGITDGTDAGQPVSQTITWLPQPVPSSKRQQRFAVRFDQPVDLGGTIRGRVEVSLKGAISGLQGVDLYYPLGSRRPDRSADIRTRVEAEFELSLASVRYQDTRIVPDERWPEDANKDRTVEFKGVIPDHTTIVELTKAISGERYYVKRVLENPPRIGGRANLVNRFWDISGRIYRGVYPVDFHLVVTGEEIYDDNGRAEAGTTNTTLTVQGAFASPQMKERVEDYWHQLSGLIDETLQKSPRLAAAEAAGQSQPDGAPTDADGPRPRDERAERIKYLRQVRAQVDEDLRKLLEED